MANLLQTASGSYVPPSSITTVLREDLMESVTVIDPYNTPVLDIIGTSTVASPVYQWEVDSLPGLVLNNTAGSIDIDGIQVQGVSEGFDYIGTTNFTTNYPYTGQPRRLTNFVQMWAAKVGISDRLKRARPSGIRDPYLWEQQKATKVIRKAMERRLFDNPSANASCVAGSASDPSRTSYLFEWATNASLNGGFAPSQTTLGSTITADAVDAAMETVTTNGGKPTILAFGQGSRADFSKDLRQVAASGLTTTINQSQIGAAEQRIIRSVTTYQGDYGPVTVMSSIQIPQSANTTGGGKAWLLDPSLIDYATYAPVEHIPLAKTGHNTKGLIVGEGGFRLLNGKGIHVINNVTT